MSVLGRAIACLLLGSRIALAANAFRVDYVVAVTAADPQHATVTWRLSGIDEIAEFRLVFRDDRTTGVTGSGTLQWSGRTLRWTPDGPYAHLRYTVAVDRRRSLHLARRGRGVRRPAAGRLVDASRNERLMVQV